MLIRLIAFVFCFCFTFSSAIEARTHTAHRRGASHSISAAKKKEQSTLAFLRKKQSSLTRKTISVVPFYFKKETTTFS